MRKISLLVLVSFLILNAGKIFAQCSSLAINGQPNSAGRCVNTTVLFTVTTTNPAGTSYQWKISTNGGFSFSNLSSGGSYSGDRKSTRLNSSH